MREESNRKHFSRVEHKQIEYGSIAQHSTVETTLLVLGVLDRDNKRRRFWVVFFKLYISTTQSKVHVERKSKLVCWCI